MGVHNRAIWCEVDRNENGASITFGTRSGQPHRLKRALCALVEVIRLPPCV